MKKKTHYDFFQEAFTNNKMAFKSDLSSQYSHMTNKVIDDLNMKLYDEDVTHYRYLFVVLGCTLVAVVLFGISFEMIRKGRERAETNEMCARLQSATSDDKSNKETF